jgi:hypothetical protein
MSSEVQGFVNPGTEVATITSAAKEDIEKVTKRLYWCCGEDQRMWKK